MKNILKAACLLSFLFVVTPLVAQSHFVPGGNSYSDIKIIDDPSASEAEISDDHYTPGGTGGYTFTDLIPSTDYTWGADGLQKAHDFAVTMMVQVTSIVFAIAAIVVILSSFRIYFKMLHGEPVVKAMQSLGLSCLFLIGATYVFPAFFGYVS